MNYKLGKYNESLTLQQQAVELMGENGMNMTILGLFFHRIGDDEKAMEVLTRAKQLYKQNVPVPDNALNVLTIYYAPSSDVKHTNRFIEGSLSQLRGFITDAIIQDTSIDDRKRFWLNFEQIFNALLMEWGYRTDDEANTALIYDNAALFSKGLMLNVESSFNSNKTPQLNVHWNDIECHLDRKDIAIEFVSFPVGNDSVMYAALTIKRGYDKPHMIPLFEQRQLQTISRDVYYTTPALASLIWNPLENELRNVKNVYFSPTGALHNIAIEYLPSEFLSNKKLHRLSSTREVVFRSKKRAKTDIYLLYGGLNYTSSPSLLANVNSYNHYTRGGTTLSFFADSVLLRSLEFQYLNGTKNEVDTIASSLEGKMVIKLTGDNGTEESLKTLARGPVQVLHLATHGRFLSRETAKREIISRNYNFILLDTTTHSLLSEDSDLTRSFLVMSGGEMLNSRRDIPKGLDDGILTAQEISKLRFSDLQLVVLSACETALGEISNEGVIGLQRGFKKAGAHAIIMSLWKVDDECTSQLMIEFYRHLNNGESIATAFERARHQIRKNPKFSHYRYWAPFILLDAI